MEEDNEVCFVFYNTLNGIPEDECLILSPTDWKWTGSGTTIPFYTKDSDTIQPPNYKYETQFNGLSESKEKFINYIDSIFNHYKSKGYIQNYMIKDFYYPYE